MDEEQQRAAELARKQVALQLGELMMANIEANAILQAMREQMLKRAMAEQKGAE